MEITIAHLYPELLNLYGDKGNIATLKWRMEQRGINVTVKEYALEDEIDFAGTDILFIGGGSEKAVRMAANRLCEIKKKFEAYADNDGVVLAVCEGFHLIGTYYKLNGKKIKCAGIIDIFAEYTPDRLIGDVLLQSSTIGSTVVGFENHCGRVEIGCYKPLGKVLYGYGNTDSAQYEGVLHQNIVGTHLHGPLLPKNPKLADYIISRALKKKYGSVTLSEIDDTLELQAHKYMADRYKNCVRKKNDDDI